MDSQSFFYLVVWPVRHCCFAPAADQNGLPASCKMDVNAFAEATAAAAGGIFSCTVLYPVEIVKNRLQLASPGQKASFVATFRNILQQEGAAGLFDGVVVSSTKQSPELRTLAVLLALLCRRHRADEAGDDSAKRHLGAH